MNKQKKAIIRKAFEKKGFHPDDISISAMEAIQDAMSMYSELSPNDGFFEDDRAHQFYEQTSKPEMYLIIRKLLSSRDDWVKSAQISKAMITPNIMSCKK